LQNTCLGTESNVIPLQLSHILDLHIFWQFNNEGFGPIVWYDFIVAGVDEEFLKKLQYTGIPLIFGHG
jgi:RsiW-degrading membrane proteinase PrsW (M82 family)